MTPPLVPGRWAGVAVAGAGGLLVAASLPPMGFWPLAVAGLVLVDRAVAGCGPKQRFTRGWVAGLALLAPTTFWIRALTFPGWILSSLLLSAFLGAALAAAPKWCGRWLALPGAWVLFEAVRGRWPFGGVPLSNIAVGQVGGPLAPVARIGGSLLVGGTTVVAAVAVAALLRRAWTQAGAAALAVAALLLLAAVAPTGSPTGRTLDVALVQGGGPQGTQAIHTDAQAVFDRHLAASESIEPGPDLVVWPEDVVDTPGPVLDYVVGEQLQDEARRLGAVLVVGTIEDEGPETFHNSAVAFAPDGALIDRTEKERRVPFGEWVPFRSLIEPLAPDTLPSRDAIVGSGVPVLTTPAGDFATVISWEVFFPDRVRHGVRGGGQLVLNPTNGSSFTGTQVQGQQVASSRLRAIETGRWVLQAAPTGFSAIVTPDGRVAQRSGVSEQVVLRGTVELRTGRTWSVRFGDWPTLALAALSLGTGWWYELHRRRLTSS